MILRKTFKGKSALFSFNSDVCKQAEKSRMICARIWESANLSIPKNISATNYKLQPQFYTRSLDISNDKIALLIL